MDCKANWQKENIKGKNHPNWKKKVVVVCNFCGKQFEKYPAWVKKCNKHFCSKKCHTAWQRKNPLKGEKSKRWNSTLLHCNFCNKELYVPNYKKKYKHHFCSRECYQSERENPQPLGVG